MGRRELILRLRCSEKTREIICRLLVSYDHACEFLRCMSEAGRCVRLGLLRVPLEFQVVSRHCRLCPMAVLVERDDHLTFKCGCR